MTEKSFFTRKIHGLRYESVYSSSEDGSETSESHSIFRRTRDNLRPWFSNIRLILVILLSTVLLLVVFFTLTGLVVSSRKAQKVPTIEGVACGGNPTDAKLQGCRFDPMMSAWIEPDCVYDELIEEAGDIFTNWPWFSDFELHHPIVGKDLDALRAGNYTKVWSSHHNAHELHCIYVWRKMAMALRHDPPLADTSNAYHHVVHCSKSLLEILNGEEPAEKVEKFAFPMMYHRCAVLQYSI
ncbi:hypothetical protein HYALB_00005047 [Hymenoscyphus albidus]|uniref:Uncharacterized protein n=1 Tax=Hymenoscyphus albidus TaxID=595503 RepID=A0A9N9LTW4_9HELO|nr:hypothetical protein HYALB_00005047 [Hymenoscyphus albidus]